MKKILTFTISLLLLQNVFAQDLVGKWNINSLIDNNYPPEEYILYPTKSDKHGIEFGLILILKSDGTFLSYRIPGCGQDRFPPSTFGKYTIIDENYISFFLEKRNEEYETLINQDLGKYYYSQKNGEFKFLKSNGNVERDKQTAYFRDLLHEKNNEINKYEDNALNWKYTGIIDEKKAVSFCLLENQIGNAEILYSRPVEGYNRTIILIQVESNFRYVVFEKDFYGQDRNRIALYDDSKIKEIDKLVDKIKNDKNLKTKTIKNNNEPKKNLNNNSDITLTLYQKKKKLHKAVYDQYTSYSDKNGNVNNIVIYYQDKEPIYVEYLTKHISSRQEPESITGFYILEFNNSKFITKPIKNYRKTSYPSGLLNKVMDEIKKTTKIKNYTQHIFC